MCPLHWKRKIGFICQQLSVVLHAGASVVAGALQVAPSFALAFVFPSFLSSIALL